MNTKLIPIVLALSTALATPTLAKSRHHPPAQRIGSAEYWSGFARDYRWQVTMPTIAAAQAWLPPPVVYELWNRALWDSR